MFYFESENRFPLEHVSSGKLVNQQHFVHTRRKLETFVLLVGISDVLYIAQDDRQYELGPNQFLLLLPGHTHYGYQESGSGLAYYWCHFLPYNGYYRILEEGQGEGQENSPPLSDCYIIPEFGSFSSGDRISLVFRQVLDLAHTQCYSNYLANYALSLLAMEISQQYVRQLELHSEEKLHSRQRISEIMEWIRINYNTGLTVQGVADQFSYNSSYLSELFKKYSGFSLLQYINHAKISMAKQLLLNSSFAVKEIAQKSGFLDEKNFMKLFKKTAGLTPTQYRNAFCHTKLNKE